MEHTVWQNKDVLNGLAGFVGEEFLFFGGVSRAWRSAWGNRPTGTRGITAHTSVVQLLYSLECGLHLAAKLCAGAAGFGRRVVQLEGLVVAVEDVFLVAFIFVRCIHDSVASPVETHVQSLSFHDIAVPPGKTVLLHGRGFVSGDRGYVALPPDMYFPQNIAPCLNEVFTRASLSPAVSLDHQAGRSQMFESPKLSLGQRNVLEGGFRGAPRDPSVGLPKRLPV